MKLAILVKNIGRAALNNRKTGAQSATHFPERSGTLRKHSQINA
jgi:hypothetical protein